MPKKESIILELQELASDSSNDVSDLLRKSLIVATKLKLEDFKHWVESELNGYESNDDIPEYRHMDTQMKVVNPFHGLQPFFLPPGLERNLCHIEFGAPISNVVAVLKNAKQHPDAMPPTVPLLPEQRQYLMNHMRVPIEPVRIVNVTCLEMILDAVRLRILNWSLELDERGITGEGMTFSKEEKDRAAGQQINIGNFQGVLGNVGDNNRLTQNLRLSVRTGDLASLAASLREQGLEKDDVSALTAAIKGDSPPTVPGKFGPKVSAWIGSMIAKAASGTWEIGTGAAGEFLGAVIGRYYGL